MEGLVTAAASWEGEAQAKKSLGIAPEERVTDPLDIR